ncbi:MAG: alpha/beta fold hydrolase [Mesonia hippocampi]|uniref:alpha/beta fold hydrolase n=1 Tax=Mesonia hippocampi TaxID=1628250 RepID=UPI003F9996C5
MESILLKQYKTQKREELNLLVYYQVVGLPIGEAPIILVNHPLTANATLIGDGGWWNAIVGENNVLDTTRYTIISINIPGNGSGEGNLLENHTALTIYDVAKVFLLTLDNLGVKKLHTIIGASIGGAISWQMATLAPTLAEQVIPIATDYKTTDWLQAICTIQASILKNAVTPLEQARQHAMLCYRTPISLNRKFKLQKSDGEFDVNAWLTHHGKALAKRYALQAYKTLNYLLSSIDIAQADGSFLKHISKIESTIHIITIPTDGLFLAEENWDTYVQLKPYKENLFIHEIKSIHGHDAFLIEQQQLANILNSIFKKSIINENNKYSSVRHR